jgi:hypothetical protein
MIALFFPLMLYMQFAASPLINEVFLIKEVFLWVVIILPAAYFAPLTFGIMAPFLEKQMTMPLNIFDILLAKYRFHCIVALYLFIFLLPSLFFGILVMELVSALFFGVGVTYFCLFYLSLFSCKSYDIKQTAFYNWQGMSAASYIFPVIVILAVGIMALLHRFFGENITLTVMLIVGLAFMATHGIWLKLIAREFEKTKHDRMERFREK